MSQNHDATLIDFLLSHSQKLDKNAFVFLKNGEKEDGSLTFSALDKNARIIASRLQRTLNEGSRVLLLFPSGLPFIVGLMGCMYAGMIAVPANLPHRRQGMERICAIVGNCDAKLILTDQASLDDLTQRMHDTPQLADVLLQAVDITEEAQSEDMAETWKRPSLTSASIAFLQYTSGSTGTPKGVAITHGNLLANERMLQEGFHDTQNSVCVNWLPLYHDMGLVGNLLHSLYLGATCILMSPMAFMQRPVRWLQAISTYRATTSGGPNFAYDLCIDKVTPQQMDGIDLSSWKVAFNGAEPVRAHTLTGFSKKFSDFGFSDNAFYPCYGMAEATVFISGGIAGTRPLVKTVLTEAIRKNQVANTDHPSQESLSLVSCGMSWGAQQIKIVDPESAQACVEGTVGEIWVNGVNVAQGYWNNENATHENFHGYMADSLTGLREGPFLRTGDLGFIDDGQLFITGRCKELIIIKGRNFYPHDIEDALVTSHVALNDGNGAAFSIEVNGEEKLIVVHEIGRHIHLDRNTAKDILRHAREAVSHYFDVHLCELVLLKPRTLPRTSSGKIRRGACRELYQQGTLPVAAESE